MKKLYVCLLLSALWAFGQAVTSSIVGTATDSGSAALAGVKIKVIDINTDAVRETVTDERGDYVVPLLRPGNYRLEASLPSFQTFVLNGIRLEMDKVIRVNTRLEVGKVTEQITVEAQGAFIKSENAEVGQVIGEKQVKDMPLNGRNFLQLAKITAGVTPSFGTRGTSEATSFSGGRSDLTMHIGGRGDSVAFMIDGVQARSKVGGFVAVPLSVDAIQEFNVKQNNFPAQYGFGESIISVITKSGTNSLHGTLYEFVRNNKFDARNFFDVRRGDYRENQFGAAIGGRILKDRTFFFGNYEGYRIRRVDTFVVSVPQREQMLGNFAGAATIRDPLSGVPFPDNRIPENRVSRWARVYREFFPTPNRVTFPNLVTTNKFTRDVNQFTSRIDHRISGSNQLFGRFTYANDDVFVPEFVQLKTRNTAPIHARNLAIHDTHIFSPTWVNVLTLGYSYVLRDTVREVFDRDLTQELGIRNSGQAPGQFRLPTSSIVGFAAFGGQGFGFGEREHTYQIANNSTITRRNHTFNFGGEVRRNIVASTITQAAAGSLQFDGAFTGNAVGDFVLGYVRALNGAAGVNNNVFKWHQLTGYVQDDWKVTPSLTLNVGLRYNLSKPISEIDGKTQTFDFRRGILMISRPLRDGGIDYEVPGIEERFTKQPRVTHYKDFEPRFGFAWRPFGATDWVVRGGYGIYYTLTQFLEQRQSTTQEAPFFIPIQVQSSAQTPEIQTDRGDVWPSAAQVFRSASLQMQAVFNPADKNPYSQQWNLAVERKWRDWLLQTTYVGKTGVHIGIRVNVNLPEPSTLPNPERRRPYPVFGPILGRFQGQNTSYQAWQTLVQRHFRSGYSILAGYTWAHAIDYESREPSATMNQDPKNWKGSRGNAAYDVRHRVVASGTYDLPFGTGKRYASSRKFVSRLVGGWQSNAIVSLSTGNYSTVTLAADRANVGAGFRHLRPDVLRNPNLPRGERTPSRWFDKSAFQLQPFGTFGNAGRNIVLNPGQNTVDFSLFKNNRIRGDSMNLQFRAEFFNFFNHPNFLGGNSTFEAVDFGQITAAAPPRSIQFGLKLIF